MRFKWVFFLFFMVQNDRLMSDTMKAKTGKSLEEWIDLAKKANLEKHGAIVKHLKSEYGLTHGYANTVALKVREADAGSIDDSDLLAAQYKGKEHLKPIYDALVSYLHALGDDIDIVPKKANVSCRRKRQFALLQPSTKSRFDLGLKLDATDPQGELEPSGPFGTMCTHRIQLTSAEDITDTTQQWLKKAYEQAG